MLYERAVAICGFPHRDGGIARVIKDAPLGPNRMAAHTMDGNTQKAKTSSVLLNRTLSSKMAMVAAAAANVISNFSCHRSSRSSAWNVTITGTTMSTPIPSPSHQTSHAGPNFNHGFTLVKYKVVTPAVAATLVLTTAPNMTSMRTSRTRPSDFWNPGRRRSKNAANKALEVFPAAIAIAAPWGMGVKKFTRNAALAMAGHIPYPHTSKAASAIPAGGQTGDTFPYVKGAASPSLPPRK